MRIITKLDKPLPIKVKYNGTEIFSQELQGDIDLEIETPKITGLAEVFAVIEGNEQLIATASYVYDQPAKE